MRSPHQKHSNKEIHLKENGEKASKWKTSSEASQQSFSPLQRCCSVTHWPPVAHSNSGDQNRLLWSKENCLDWPSLRQPWQFCSSLPSAQSGRLSHLSDVNTWTQSSTQKRIQTFVVEYNYVQCADLLHSSTHFPSPQSCWKSGHCRMLENDLKCRKSTGGNSIIYHIIIYIKRHILYDMI